jgi:hypothetical protein
MGFFFPSSRRHSLSPLCTLCPKREDRSFQGGSLIVGAHCLLACRSEGTAVLISGRTFFEEQS